MQSSLNWVLVVLGAVLILLEVVLGAISGFDFLLIGAAMLLGGFLGVATKSVAVGTVTAGVLALAYVFVGRRRIRGRLGHQNLATNTDALLGRDGRVVDPITPERAGRVRIDGDEWRAQVANGYEGSLEIGRTVRVERIDGVTLHVKPHATGGSPL